MPTRWPNCAFAEPTNSGSSFGLINYHRNELHPIYSVVGAVILLFIIGLIKKGK